MKEVDMGVLAASRSTFIATENGVTWAICSLHVDDGLLVGGESDPHFIQLRERINQRFNIKEWKHLSPEEPLSFLGLKIHQEAEGFNFTDRMDKYVAGIEPPVAPKRSADDPLAEEEVTQFRRLIMKMRWPAQHCMPQLLYTR